MAGQPGRETFAEWGPRFLEVLAKSPNVRAAARAAHIHHSTVYNRIKKSPVFAAQVKEALDESTDMLEAMCYSRAMGGSDQLMMFLLKARRPEYRDRQELSGPGGGAIPIGVANLEGSDLYDELVRIAPGLERCRAKAAPPEGDCLPPGFSGPV